MGGRPNITHDCGDQNRYFKPNHDVFLTLSMQFSHLNLRRAWAQHFDKREIQNTAQTNVKLQHEETFLAKKNCSGDRVESFRPANQNNELKDTKKQSGMFHGFIIVTDHVVMWPIGKTNILLWMLKLVVIITCQKNTWNK